jgi:hypothetical protein
MLPLPFSHRICVTYEVAFCYPSLYPPCYPFPRHPGLLSAYTLALTPLLRPVRPTYMYRHSQNGTRRNGGLRYLLYTNTNEEEHDAEDESDHFGVVSQMHPGAGSMNEIPKLEKKLGIT